MEQEVPDVEGTLWLDGESAQLRFLEYRYTRYPHRLEDTRNLGGRVDFQRRGDGRWFVPGVGHPHAADEHGCLRGADSAWTGSWRRGAR